MTQILTSALTIAAWREGEHSQPELIAQLEKEAAMISSGELSLDCAAALTKLHKAEVQALSNPSPAIKAAFDRRRIAIRDKRRSPWAAHGKAEPMHVAVTMTDEPKPEPLQVSVTMIEQPPQQPLRVFVKMDSDKISGA